MNVDPKEEAEVCLVVPTLGMRHEYLDACLASLEVQGSIVEVILVGPSNAMCAREIALKHGFRWVDQAGSGLSGAVMQGWQCSGSNAPYLAWLGDDDLLLPGALKACVTILNRRQNVVMVYGRCRVIDGEGRGTHLLRPGRFSAWLMRFDRDFVPQPGSVFRRSTVVEVGGLDESLKFAMDLDLFIRLRSRGRLAYVPRTLSAFRRHAGSLTVSNPMPDLEAALVRARYLTPLSLRWKPMWEPLARSIGRIWGYVQFHGMRVRHD